MKQARTVRISYLLFFGLALCLCGFFYLSLEGPSPYHNEELSKSKNCDCNSRNIKSSSYNLSKRNILSKDVHKLAILVPFRDRFEELMEFVPYISSFLVNQKKDFHIFIINQVDTLRFNRALLLNVGFLESGSIFDHIALHDVDLLPLNPAVLYPFPKEGPFHVSAPVLHPRYHYPTFIGGILLINRDQFRKVNGMSDQYWGWGLEDDEFYARLKDAHLNVFRPTNIDTGNKGTFRHLHERKVRKRDMVMCYDQQRVTRHRDRISGLNTTNYKVINRKEMTVEGFPFTVLNVALGCDFGRTPWCNCTKSGHNGQAKLSPVAEVIAPKINRKKHVSFDQ